MKIAQINTLNNNDPIINTELMVTSNDGHRDTKSGIVTNYTMCDDTGATIKVGMFGAGNGSFQSGQNLSIRAQINGQGAPKGVLVNDYKGTKSITVFDNATVSPTAGSTQAANQQDTGFASPPTQQIVQPMSMTQPIQTQQLQPAQQTQQTNTNNERAEINELAQIWTRTYNAYKAALIASGIDPNEAAQAAQGAPGFTAQYWFGKDRSKIEGL